MHTGSFRSTWLIWFAWIVQRCPIFISLSFFTAIVFLLARRWTFTAHLYKKKIKILTWHRVKYSYFMNIFFNFMLMSQLFHAYLLPFHFNSFLILSSVQHGKRWVFLGLMVSICFFFIGHFVTLLLTNGTWPWIQLRSQTLMLILIYWPRVTCVI